MMQFLRHLSFKMNIELPQDNSENKKIKYLKPDELIEFFKNIPKSNIRDKAIIRTLYRTELRV